MKVIQDDCIVEQIREKFCPSRIILFGSRAKGIAKYNSDIDLCVVMETAAKRKTIADLYYEIESSVHIDFLLYTPDEWYECISDISSFAYKILMEGIVLYDG